MDALPGEKLAALLGAALEQKVGEKIGSFGGLLTREAAVQLLCQENGITTEKRLMLSEARISLLPFSFSARVDRVFPIQQFPGGSMRTVRLHISDASGEATLVLWNEQVRLADGIALSGNTIECTGAYSRAGEISIGKNGAIVPSGKHTAVPLLELKGGVCNVGGVVGEVVGPRSYKDRKTGEEKTMHSFSICEGSKCVRVVAWSLPEGAKLPRQGERVALENATFRNGELHLNAFSRIVAGAISSAGGKAGKFLGAAVEGDAVAIAIGDEKFSMPVADALRLLGIKSVPPGVGASTIISIKSRALEGKEAHYFLEGGKLASLKFEN